MTRLPETRISLILRLAGPADVQAWEEFADLYAPAIYGLALRKGLQPADAEDITQEVLFGVARAVERFQPDASRASFRTWLSRIARNMIADFCRRRARPVNQAQTHDWNLESASVDDSQDELAFETEYRAAVYQMAARRVRQRVRESTWQAFYRTTIAGESAKEVAHSLELSLGSLYVARSRVVKMLRDEGLRLERQYEGELSGQAQSEDQATEEPRT